MAIAITSTPPALVAPNAAYTATFVVSGHVGAVDWNCIGFPSDFIATVVDDVTLTVTAPAGGSHPLGKFSAVVYVTDSSAFTTNKSYTLYVASAPTLSTPKLPNTGVVGLPFAGRISVAGGIQPFTFALTAGSLPTGVALTAGTGVLAGSPSAAGLKSGITIRLTDAAGQVVSTTALSINIAASGAAAISIADGPLFSGKEGSVYSSATKTGGGSGSGYAYALASGTLPSGVTVNTSTGSIAGTPAAGSAGTYAGISVSVTDSLGNTATTTPFTLVVAPATAPIVMGIGANRRMAVGSSFRQRIAVTGMSGDIAFTAIDALPLGLEMSVSLSNGLITGTVKKAGIFSIRIRATETSSSKTGDSLPFVLTATTKTRRTLPRTRYAA
jgi:hypothetical protein